MHKIHTDKAPAAVGPYSQAIVSGGMVYTSGQIAIDPQTNTIAAADIAGQTEQVMQNLAAVLEAAGSSFAQAVKTTCFLADMGDFAAFNEIYGRYFTSLPARSCVAVRTLPKNVLVEVEVIAEVGGNTKSLRDPMGCADFFAWRGFGWMCADSVTRMRIICLCSRSMRVSLRGWSWRSRRFAGARTGHLR